MVFVDFGNPDEYDDRFGCKNYDFDGDGVSDEYEWYDAGFAEDYDYDHDTNDDDVLDDNEWEPFDQDEEWFWSST